MLTSLFALWCQFQQTFRSINHFIWTAQSCFSCFLLPTKCLIKNSQEKFLLSIFLSLENSVLHMSCYIMTNYNIEWMLSWLPFAGQKCASICCFEKPVCFSRQTIWLKQKSALIAWCSSAVSRHWFWSNKLNFCACSNKNSINKPMLQNHPLRDNFERPRGSVNCLDSLSFIVIYRRWMDFLQSVGTI